jgi:putative hydrolase
MDPLTALREIAFLLERSQAPDVKVKAFRNAASVVALHREEVTARVQAGSLRELKGIGGSTEAVIVQCLKGEVPEYLQRVRAAPNPLPRLDPAASAVLGSLRGDLHSHSDWSDGGSPIEEMVVSAIELGRQYLALTDHSPRLTVAHGLTAERLTRQLAVVDQLRPQLGDFTLLSGIEVDILDDGALDQSPGLLADLDVVVASVHSKLAMEPAAMTRRLLAAVRNRHIDILGHCTGRMVGSRQRPESRFDRSAVFDACATAGVAVEINCRPERRDPPEALIELALDAGCLFSLDSDAHAPGQLDWLANGCARAAACGVPADRIVNTWPVDRLRSWTNRPRR